MAKNFAEIAFTDAVKQLQEERDNCLDKKYKRLVYK